MKRCSFHSDAGEEYSEAARYYERIDPELGGRFFYEVERLILEIRRDPSRFPLFDTPLRRHFSNVFPYAVLYSDQPDRVLIIPIMHMKRRPGYWRGRLG